MPKSEIRIEIHDSEGTRFHPLQLFLEDWLSDICEDSFSLHRRYDPEFYDPQYSLTFDSRADAVAVKLKDIPDELSKYIKIS